MYKIGLDFTHIVEIENLYWTAFLNKVFVIMILENYMHNTQKKIRKLLKLINPFKDLKI